MKNLVDLVHKGLASDLFQMDYVTFIKAIQESIPEAAYLRGEANVSAEGSPEAHSEKKLHGIVMVDEEIRAFSGLLRFKDVISGDEASYQTFIECQIEMKKPVLTRESFGQLGQYVKEKLSSPEDFAAAIWSILCNDLGKVHVLIAEHAKRVDEKVIGHDWLLAELLGLAPELFQCFNLLPMEHREQIIWGYASGCDISQFEQLELPIVSFKALKQLDKQSLDLYILHSIFDVSGAAAHFKSNGSLTMHEETWQFFDATRRSLEQLHTPERKSIEDAYDSYLDYRGRCIGIPRTTPASVALIRIAGLARLATPSQGEMLRMVFDSLPEGQKLILIRELNIHGGLGVRAIFVGYGVAMLLNPQGALQKELTTSQTVVTAEQRAFATQEGLKIGLIHMAKALKLARETIGDDSTEVFFVAECDAIARALNKNPRDSLHMDWTVTAASERRMDFDFVPRLLMQTIPLEEETERQAITTSVVALSQMAHHSGSPIHHRVVAPSSLVSEQGSSLSEHSNFK